jgi:hypothetical protein
LTGAITTASVCSATGAPPTAMRLASPTRTRRMGQNWKYVPSSPAGRRPASRARSATHAEARISSSVPASRPRMPSPASANRSRRRSASVIASMAAAAAGRAAGLGAEAAAAGGEGGQRGERGLARDAAE